MYSKYTINSVNFFNKELDKKKKKTNMYCKVLIHTLHSNDPKPDFGKIDYFFFLLKWVTNHNPQ